MLTIPKRPEEAMFMKHLHDADRMGAERAPTALVLLRLAIGFVFITEGVQKFLEPETLGAGRFAKIGIPYPEILGPFVGGVEIACGTLVLIGLLTRLGAFALVIDMLVAIVATKLPILLGYGFLGFADPAAGHTGFWAAAHEARLDLTLLLGCGLLVAVGPGRLSFDAPG
jgi:putative oxidoreductase